MTARWDPSAQESVSVEGLRRRVSELWRRWAKLWTLLRQHCYATAAFVSCEISEQGHVHLHVALFSMWVSREWLASQWGDHVDVREAKSGSEREVAKYALKSHSPLDSGWLSGRHRRLVHPRLAARWEAATARVHLRRVYGELRDLDVPAEVLPRREETCSCGAPLPSPDQWRYIETTDLAYRGIRAKARIHWHFWPPWREQ